MYGTVPYTSITVQFQAQSKMVLRPLLKQSSRLHGTISHVFKVQNYKLHKLEDGPNINVELSKQEAIKMYTQMQNIRKLETNIGNMYKAKQVRGFCHLCNGQEACTVGIFQAMRPQDTLISAYRIHGWCYLMSNSNAFAVFSELLAKKTGVSRGRGGSMHMYTTNFYGGNGIVGAQVPLGAGLAFATKYLETKGVSFILYGDGAANQGQAFEAFNMAKLWNLPCVFVCENNEYGMGTSASRSSASVDYYTRGDYIPGIYVDGMDVLAVKQATKFVIDHCMSEKGPIVMELKTYRYFGHSMSDPGTTYRTREEVQQVRLTRDPIKTFSTRLMESNLVSEEDLKIIDFDIKKKMDAETQRALKETELPLENLVGNIYKNCVDDNIRGRISLSWLKHKSL